MDFIKYLLWARLDQMLRTQVSKAWQVLKKLLDEEREAHDLTITHLQGVSTEGRADIWSRDGGWGAGRTPDLSGG